eukprot:GHVP01019621.1.p2 GENE.GHVP01019621.1~~GHVP01019621.1.p2  ORF type:complete len:340 (+),score=61.12 GHVP01019621.1:2871-3890(+)
MGKYTTLSPSRTAIVLRSIRWGRLLYSSEFLPLSEETLQKEQSIFDKAIFKQSKYMHNHLAAREVGCDFLVKAEHAVRILNFARRMYKKDDCPEMKEATDLLLDGHIPKPGSYFADIKKVLGEFGIDLVDAITSPETQAREFRYKIRCHAALLRQKEVKDKVMTHQWRKEIQPLCSFKMSPIFHHPNSVALFHFRLPSLEIGCLKGIELQNDQRDDCPFCGSANSNNGRHIISCNSLPDDLTERRNELLKPLNSIMSLEVTSDDLGKPLQWMKDILKEGARRAETKRAETAKTGVEALEGAIVAPLQQICHKDKKTDQRGNCSSSISSRTDCTQKSKHW